MRINSLVNTRIEPAVPLLLVGNFLSGKYGTRGVCEDLAFRFAGAGHAVTTTSNKLNRGVRLLDMIYTALHQRKKYRVALVDVYSGPAFMWAEAVCWALRQVNKPYALTLHGGSLPEFAKRSPKRVKHLLESAVLVTTPSRFLLEGMAEYRKDLCLQPNPLDINSYAYKPRTTVAPRLVWLRAFHEIYNPTLAPQVLALLQKEFPASTLMMVGPDKGDGTLARIKKLARQLGVAGSLHLPGSVPKSEISHWMNQGDIFLNTTNIDNTPVSVLEAMACGLCVVSTNVGGIPYLLEDGHDALLVPPNDPQAACDAVRRILSEPELAMRLSRNARRKAEQHDWSIILPRWRELLTKAARSKTE